MLLMCILVKDEVTAFLHYFTRKWIHACNRPGMGAIKIANIVVIVKSMDLLSAKDDDEGEKHNTY